MVMVKLDSHVEESTCIPILNIKINSKLIKYLNAKTWNHKTLGIKHRGKLLDIAIGNGYLD